MAEYVNPFLRGMLRPSQAWEVAQQRRSQHDLGMLSGILNLQHAMANREREAQMFPLQMEALKAQAADREGMARYRDAQIADMQRKGVLSERQDMARGVLSNLLATGGYSGVDGQGAPAPTSVAMSDDEALAKFGVRKLPDGSIERIPGATPPPPGQSVAVPNPANVRGLAILADPAHAIPELLRQQRPPRDPSTLGMHPVVVHDTNSPTGWSHRDLRTGAVTPGAPPPSSATRNEPIPSGYRQNASGGLEFLPGGPADPATKDLGPGVHRLPNGASISNSQLLQQYKVESNLMDPIDLQILSRTDPARAARERDKISNAQPFQQWARQRFGVDVSGGFNPPAPSPGPSPAPQPAPSFPRAAPQARKTLNGKSYVKINGQWFEE